MKSFVIRFKKGDNLIPSIIKFCQKNHIESAWFSGLGAASSTNLCIYNLEKKEYSRKKFSGKLEILNLLGNIGKLNDETVVHCHVTLSDENFSVIGGHLDKLIVAATCEIILYEWDIQLTRKYNQNIGLNLLDL